MKERVKMQAKKEGNIALHNHGTDEQVMDFYLQKVQ